MSKEYDGDNTRKEYADPKHREWLKSRVEKYMKQATGELGPDVSDNDLDDRVLELLDNDNEQPPKEEPTKWGDLDGYQARRCPNPACDGFCLTLHKHLDYVVCGTCGTRGPVFDGHPGIAVNSWNHLPRQEDVDNLKLWVSDLQSGMYINCVYCGHRYGPSNEAPQAMSEVLTKHIAECPKHPFNHAKKRIAELEKLLEEKNNG